MAAAKILFSHGHYHGAVGIASVSGLIAHAVHGQSAFLRRCIDHIAPGTHAKGVDPTAAGNLSRQFIGSGRKLLWIVCPILAEINHFLGMLHADAHSKGFLLHGNSFFPKHPKGIPGTVARRKYENVRFQLIGFFLCSLTAHRLYAFHAAFP